MTHIGGWAGGRRAARPPCTLILPEGEGAKNREEWIRATLARERGPIPGDGAGIRSGERIPDPERTRWKRSNCSTEADTPSLFERNYGRKRLGSSIFDRCRCGREEGFRITRLNTAKWCVNWRSGSRKSQRDVWNFVDSETGSCRNDFGVMRKMVACSGCANARSPRNRHPTSSKRRKKRLVQPEQATTRKMDSA